MNPGSVEELVEAVREGGVLLPRGGRSKPALCRGPAGTEPLEMGRLSGVVEYEPGEFTITVKAGTPLREVEALLSEHGQYLPFDPLFGRSGATVGGTVAAGTNGPGRLRYGGLRDFLLGVRLVDGRGRLLRGGGKVVKNAAGFDLPKLMVGSLGRLGILTELTFKVFPAPRASGTLELRVAGFEAAHAVARRLLALPFELDALELDPAGRLWVRLAGSREALDGRLERLASAVSEPAEGREVEVRRLDSAAADRLWSEALACGWAPPGAPLVKVPLTPRSVTPLEERLRSAAGPRRYGAGGQQGLISWPRELDALHSLLGELGLAGLVLRGDESERVWLGSRPAGIVLDRVKRVLDPEGSLPAYPVR